MKVANSFPIARHSIVKVQSKEKKRNSKSRKDGFCMFGGLDQNSQPTGRLHLLETHCSPWRLTELGTTGNGPTARYDHICHYLPASNLLLIHGGRTLTEFYSDTHLLDLETMIWATVAYTNPALAIPRSSSLSFVYSKIPPKSAEKLYLCSGISNDSLVPSSEISLLSLAHTPPPQVIQTEQPKGSQEGPAEKRSLPDSSLPKLYPSKSRYHASNTTLPDQSSLREDKLKQTQPAQAPKSPLRGYLPLPPDTLNARHQSDHKPSHHPHRRPH